MRQEVAYKLQPEAGETETSSDPIVPDVPNLSLGRILLHAFLLACRLPPVPRPLFGHSLPLRLTIRKPDPVERPRGRKKIHPVETFRLTPSGKLRTEAQRQYKRLELIAQGANQALDNCGPENIVREIARRANRQELEQVRAELEQVRNENALLQAQVAAMSDELDQMNEELRRYHAEQAVVFRRFRELVGNSAEAFTKAHLYDKLLATKDLTSARKTIPILVKYSHSMKELLAEIQKVVPPGHTPRRVLYQGPPGSSTGTLYEVVGEVPLVQNPPTDAGTSQQGGGSRPSSSGKDPSGTRSEVRRKSTGSVQTGRGQSPVQRNSDRSGTPDRARTPIRSPVPAPVPEGLQPALRQLCLRTD